jgi:hypothetical protein
VRERVAVAVTVAIAIAAGCGADDGATPARDAGRDAPRPDARLASCGLELPGIECGGPAEIDRCDGSRVVTTTCDAGLLCGADPASGTGAACLAPGGECGRITDDGVCSGAILTRCAEDKLATFDCRTIFGVCSTPLGRCTHECEAATLSPQGRCEGNLLTRCVFADGQYRVDRRLCPPGTSCTAHPETGGPHCATSPTCPDLGGAGACDGDVLRRCAGGAPVTTDCAARGEVCAWGGEAAGHVCAPPGAAGARRVAGILRYEDRPQRLDGYGPATPRPIRGAAVTVVEDGSGRTLGAGVSDDEGRYEVRYDAPEGAPVHVLAVSYSPARLRPARVLRADGLLHGFAGPTIAAGLTETVDLLVTERSGAAGAFNVLDQLVGSLDAVRALFQIGEPVPVLAIWVKGLDRGTFVSGTTLTLLGSIADDDGYDDAVILHEVGHTVENAYGRSDSPGGLHLIGRPLRPTLAWSEGFATYFGAVVRGDPVYVDTVTLGGIHFDIDRDVTPAVLELPPTQELTENTVAEILWDLGDSGDGDDDPASGSHAPVLRVQDLSLKTSSGARGAAGVDLVDFLDGFLFLGGPPSCEGVRAVVASRQFPYDFAGPLPCP